MTHQFLPPEVWLERFRKLLEQQGYRPKTLRRYLYVCEQFVLYLIEQDITLEQVSPKALEVYYQRQAEHFQERRNRSPCGNSIFNRGITDLLSLIHGSWPPIM